MDGCVSACVVEREREEGKRTRGRKSAEGKKSEWCVWSCQVQRKFEKTDSRETSKQNTLHSLVVRCAMRYAMSGVLSTNNEVNAKRPKEYVCGWRAGMWGVKDRDDFEVETKQKKTNNKNNVVWRLIAPDICLSLPSLTTRTIIGHICSIAALL